jgi:transcriptional regulator with XRE-family HTH domain
MNTTLSKQQRANLRCAFGASVRSRRASLKISQEELAFRSGLHRTYVGSVERGERNISLENIYLLANALRCRAEDLLPS